MQSDNWIRHRESSGTAAACLRACAVLVNGCFGRENGGIAKAASVRVGSMLASDVLPQCVECANDGAAITLVLNALTAASVVTTATPTAARSCSRALRSVCVRMLLRNSDQGTREAAASLLVYLL